MRVDKRPVAIFDDVRMSEMMIGRKPSLHTLFLDVRADWELLVLPALTKSRDELVQVGLPVFDQEPTIPSEASSILFGY